MTGDNGEYFLTQDGKQICFATRDPLMSKQHLQALACYWRRATTKKTEKTHAAFRPNSL
jgi:hypothetical protein